jgi:hypothetical protein
MGGTMATGLSICIFREMLKKSASEIIYRKYATKTTMSAKILRSLTRRANTNDSIFVGN